MRERSPFICECCNKSTHKMIAIRYKTISLDICPECFEHIKTHYSEFEIVRYETN